MSDGDLRQYLGDGLYVRYDGFHIWIDSSNGIRVIDSIAMEPSVLRAFDLWRERTKEARKG